MSRQQRPITDREIKAWLAAGAVDRGVGEGLTFVASTIAAQAGKASWILRYRLNGRSKEKALGRYPELSLKDAREQVPARNFGAAGTTQWGAGGDREHARRRWNAGHGTGGTCGA